MLQLQFETEIGTIKGEISALVIASFDAPDRSVGDNYPVLFDIELRSPKNPTKPLNKRVWDMMTKQHIEALENESIARAEKEFPEDDGSDFRRNVFGSW